MRSPIVMSPAGLAPGRCVRVNCCRASWGAPGTSSMGSGADTTQSDLAPPQSVPVCSRPREPRHHRLLSTAQASAASLRRGRARCARARDCLHPAWAALSPRRDRTGRGSLSGGPGFPGPHWPRGEIPFGAVDARQPSSHTGIRPTNPAVKPDGMAPMKPLTNRGTSAHGCAPGILGHLDGPSTHSAGGLRLGDDRARNGRRLRRGLPSLIRQTARRRLPEHMPANDRTASGPGEGGMIDSPSPRRYSGLAVTPLRRTSRSASFSSSLTPAEPLR